MKEDMKVFAKGVGTGMIMGSALGMMAAGATEMTKKSPKSNVVGKAFKTMGDMIENIGDSIGF